MIENQTTELTVIISPELSKVISENTSIEVPVAQSFARAFAHNMETVTSLSKALSTMDKENPSPNEAKIARIERLALVKNRTATGKVKDDLKEGLLIQTKLIDSLHNVVKHSSELIEAEYEAIEKHAENKEKERKQKLFNERLAYISAVCENPSIYPLAELEEKDFNDLYEGLKLADQAKRDAIIKAENERVKAEQDAEDARIEAKRIADEQSEAQRLENIRLKELSDLKAKRTSELMPYVVYIRDFNALLAQDEEEYQLQFADIRKGAEIQISMENARQKEIIQAQINRCDKALEFLLQNHFKESSNGVIHTKYFHFINENRFNSFDSDEQLEEFKTEILNANIRDDKAKATELENARLAKELQDKKDADAKAENERKALELAEEKRKKALAKAGDKVRLNTWISNFDIPELDTKGMTKESIEKAKDIVAKFELFKTWSKTQTESI